MVSNEIYKLDYAPAKNARWLGYFVASFSLFLAAGTIGMPGAYTFDRTLEVERPLGRKALPTDFMILYSALLFLTGIAFIAISIRRRKAPHWFAAILIGFIPIWACLLFLLVN